jgi:hypothetical protein
MTIETLNKFDVNNYEIWKSIDGEVVLQAKLQGERLASSATDTEREYSKVQLMNDKIWCEAVYFAKSIKENEDILSQYNKKINISDLPEKDLKKHVSRKRAYYFPRTLEKYKFGVVNRKYC